MKVDAVDFYYLSMPVIHDIGDGSQDLLLVRVQAGEHVGWGECEASPLVSIAALVTPMSHSACKPVLASVLGQRLVAGRQARATTPGGRPCLPLHRSMSPGNRCVIPRRLADPDRRRVSPAPANSRRCR